MKRKTTSFWDSLVGCFFISATIIFCICAFIIGKMTYNNVNAQKVQSTSKLVQMSKTSKAQSVSTTVPVGSNGMCLIDGKTGNIIYEYNSNAALPMASTTKIMTALIALEKLPPDKIISVNKNACNVEGSSIYLTPDEKITCLDLVYGLMLESGNDAAAALAYEISGSIESFASLMNSKAKELGLENTSFANPHGLSNSNHYTTAYELALICAQAYKNPLFSQIAASKSYTSTTNTTTRSFSNHNKLLQSYSGAIGVKTGYTINSGRCLVSAAQRDDTMFICVTLNAKDDWNIHTQLLDRAFAQYKTITLAKAHTFCVSHKGIKYTNPQSIYLTVPKDTSCAYSYNTSIYNGVVTVKVYADNKEQASFELTEKSDIESE